MIAIVWHKDGDRESSKTVVGSNASIISLAHILECNKIKFKVTSIDTRVISQEALGVGGFEFWLKENDSFGE